MKVVIQTQHRENYAAHDWSGEGECPQGWKYKGGDTYVVEGVTLDQARGTEFWDQCAAAITSSNDYYEEYVIDSYLVDDIDYDVSKVCDEWETPIMLTLHKGKFRAVREQADDESRENGSYIGYMPHGIAKKRETWLQVAGEREDYAVVYTKTDGTLVDWQGNPLPVAA